MSLLRIVCAAAAALLVGCSSCAGFAPAPTGPAPVATEDAQLAGCPGFCARLRAHSCEEAQPTAMGEACEPFCERQVNSHEFRVESACVVESDGTLSGIRGCGIGCANGTP